MRRPRKLPVIEFRCRADDRGVTAEPVPVLSAPPDWFHRLPGVDGDKLTATNDGVTVKRCVAFLDSLSIGWVPLGATVRTQVTDGGKHVQAGWVRPDHVSNHSPFQVVGNPYEPLGEDGLHE
jgi:hypothetical protein